MKQSIQTVLKLLGYRLVPRVRDPGTALDIVFSCPVDAVIDVGANQGTTCLEWLRRFPAAQVFAFEPLPDLAETILARTARDASRITVFQIAASDRPGQAEFNVHTEHPSSSSLQAATTVSNEVLPFTTRTRQITVQTDTLDAILKDEIFSEAFLKLDVQGHELAVLTGANSILRSVRFVQVEINLQSLYEKQPSFVEIIELLNRSGFRFIGITEQYHLANGRPVFLDALFERL